MQMIFSFLLTELNLLNVCLLFSTYGIRTNLYTYIIQPAACVAKIVSDMFTVVIWLYACSNNITMNFFVSLEVKRGILLDLSRKIAFLSLFSMPVLITLKIKLQLLLQQKIK
jgi:hypothetical protein